MQGRCIGMDVHRDFCEVAIWDAGEVVRAPRVPSRPGQLQEFALQLRPTDRVAMEATGNALAIARIIGPHVAAVEIVNTRRLKAITASKQKTDRHDAKTLAQLLAAGMFAGSWQPDEATRMLRRRVARRARLVVHRTRSKNEILAVLHRNLKPRPPMSDPFGVAGRAWLARQELPVDEQDTVNAALRQIDFLNDEIATIETELARFATGSAEAKQLMTVPGVGLVTATAFLAQVGEVTRFPNPNQLVSYLGLNPSVRQSGDNDAHTGRISKEGSALVRHVLVEAAQTAIRSPGPLRAFFERVRARRGHAVAIVAVARKLAVLFWRLLVSGQDYAYSMPTPTAKKLRAVELKAGAPSRRGGGSQHALNREARRKLERRSAEHAEAAYRRNVADWHRQQAKGARTAT
ncbi:Transposase IS116/IS110/IS902 family [Gaiella occulta]|uniref:Transposase IS116/IS110/IS902 family n=2 Tax=Gaiella occulta TaxID=1002870 RepID=A0A7M2YTV4_9ACTN|nr:IS110 family transposase [Gaiella occulta]RDI73180.1 Transposase IS116/IS110/IS902 family [Gaiella occulta]